MNLRNSFLIAVLVVLTTWGVSVQPAQARTVDKLKVSEGYDDRNTITSPIFDGTDLPPLSIGEFTESFDREARVFQRRKGLMRGGLNSKLGPKVQPAEIFAELLRTEADKMGLPVGDGGWVLSGNVRKILLENDVPSTWAMGVMLFYGTFELDLRLTSPDGEQTELSLTLYSYSVQGGLNGLKSARDAMSELLIEGAQETLSYLNRERFKAPPHASMADRIASLEQGKDEDGNISHIAGLSGYTAAIPMMLERLAVDDTEFGRSRMINAMARLRSPEVIQVLQSRYGKEDDDCRWYTLKAMAYIGTDEALNVVREKGPGDEEEYFRQFANRILEH
jgi:hypothetical protein